MSSSAPPAQVEATAVKRPRKAKRVSKRVVKKADGRYLIYYEKI